MKSVEQFDIKTLEVAGLGSALQALRLPFGKECRSLVYNNVNQVLRGTETLMSSSTIYLNDKDKELIKTLLKRGDEHAKVLRGVMVWCEINAPRYWWQELSTYRVGTECLSSESTMHIEGKGMPEEELIKMKEELPEGHMQKRVWMFSYQTLRRIYFQRRNHKLPQWRTFCEWIEALPFAGDFITLENK